jgi:hypothetical protein
VAAALGDDRGGALVVLGGDEVARGVIPLAAREVVVGAARVLGGQRARLRLLTKSPL